MPVPQHQPLDNININMSTPTKNEMEVSPYPPTSLQARIRNTELAKDISAFVFVYLERSNSYKSKWCEHMSKFLDMYSLAYWMYILYLSGFGSVLRLQLNGLQWIRENEMIAFATWMQMVPRLGAVLRRRGRDSAARILRVYVTVALWLAAIVATGVGAVREKDAWKGVYAGVLSVLLILVVTLEVFVTTRSRSKGDSEVEKGGEKTDEIVDSQVS